MKRLIWKIKYIQRFHTTPKKATNDYYYTTFASKFQNDSIKENLEKFNVDYFYVDFPFVDRRYKVHKDQIEKLPRYNEDEGLGEEPFIPVAKDVNGSYYGFPLLEGKIYELDLIEFRAKSNWVKVCNSSK